MPNGGCVNTAAGIPDIKKFLKCRVSELGGQGPGGRNRRHEQPFVVAMAGKVPCNRPAPDARFADVLISRCAPWMNQLLILARESALSVTRSDALKTVTYYFLFRRAALISFL
jgi:hypothetical protein